MRTTKKLTVSAMMIAIGVLFMTLGYFVEALDLTVAALLSAVVVFTVIEIGSPYTYMVWLGTSLLGALFFTGSFVWLNYFLIFGIYPILKSYFERLPRWASYIVKLLFFNLALIAVIFLSELIFGIPFFSLEQNLADYADIIKAALYVGFNVAFILYDIFLNLIIRAYYVRFRAKFSRFLR